MSSDTLYSSSEPNAHVSRSIFISYSRANAAFAIDLYFTLKEIGFTLWRDRSEMEAGKDWWQQIQEAIRSVETVVLVLSPTAVASPIVAKEWRYARQVGTRVIPVLAENVDFASVPRWMARLDWLDFRPGAPESSLIWTKFVSQLNTPYVPIHVPFTVPNLPEHFVERVEYQSPLRGELLDQSSPSSRSKRLVLTGGGGFGKTVLAQALCFNADVQEMFSDGILWVNVGEQPDVLRLLLDQIELLSGQRPELTDINDCASKLRDAIADRDVLMVLDDVWREVDVLPFIQGGSECAYVFTTRRQDLANWLGAKAVVVGTLGTDEAIQLLGGWLDDPLPDNDLLRSFATQLGAWPLLVDLAGGYLRELVLQDNLTLYGAVEELKRLLKSRGFTAFDRTDENQRNRAISISLELSLERLGAARPRFLELAIFPRNIWIPFNTISQLWLATSHMNHSETEAMLRDMRRLSLFSQFDLSERMLRVHDVISAYLRSMLANPADLNGQLVDAWGDPNTLPDEYAWRNYGFHLVQANRRVELFHLLTTYGWLEAKLVSTEIDALISDYELLGENGDLLLVKYALSSSLHVLRRDKTQLAAQLVGRLMIHQESPLVSNLLATVSPRHPWIRPLNVALEQASKSTVITLVGHSDTVNAVTVTPDDRIVVTASRDKTVRLWDIYTGRMMRILEGHAAAVNAVVVTPDGHEILSGSTDGSVRVWDVQTGKPLRELVGPSGKASELELSLPESSGMWGSVKDGTELGPGLPQNGGAVMAIDFISHGRNVVVGTVRGELWITNLDGMNEPQLIRQADNCAIRAIAATQEGNFVVAAFSNKAVEIYDLATSGEVRTLGTAAFGVAIVPDRLELLTAFGNIGFDRYELEDTCEDCGITAWQLPIGEPLYSLSSYNMLTCIATSRDGQYAAVGSSNLPAWWSHDSSFVVQLWRLSTRELVRTVAAHSDNVTSVALTSDGRYTISGSRDRTARVWGLLSPGPQGMPVAHPEGVTKVAISADGRTALSASGNGKEVIAWKVGGKGSMRWSHRKDVASIAITSDGHYAASNSRMSVKVINLVTRNEIFDVGYSSDSEWVVDLATGKENLQQPSGVNRASLDAIGVTGDGAYVILVFRQYTTLTPGPDPRLEDQLQIWNLHTHKLIHAGGLTVVRLSWADRFELTGSWDEGQYVILDRLTGREIPMIVKSHAANNRVDATGDQGRYSLALLKDTDTLCLPAGNGGPCIATFTPDFAPTCFDISSTGTIVTGDRAGHVTFLQVES